MSIRTYSVRELQRIVMESASEFKPVLGKDVERDNQKNNDKAYKDAEKETKEFDGGLTNKDSKSIEIPKDDNKGMQDLQYDSINDDFKKRVKSQIKGYTSNDAEKKHSNDAFGNAEFNDVKGMDKKSKDFKWGELTGKEIGLTSREIPKEKFANLSHSVFESNKYPQLKFKNTIFVNESHMLSKVPDDYKVEGRKFGMKDKNGNEYIVEWGDEPKVIPVTKINEEKRRIHELFNYKSGESSTSCKSRIREENKVQDMLDKARQLMK